MAKNYTKGYTDTQTKIRDATSNDPWGPSGTQMNEIAQLTYNQYVSISCCPLGIVGKIVKAYARRDGVWVRSGSGEIMTAHGVLVLVKLVRRMSTRQELLVQVRELGQACG